MEPNMAAFDSFGVVAPAVDAFSSMVMDGDEYVHCVKCGYGGCDVRVLVCGCTMHTRCTVLDPAGPMNNCPNCYKPTQGLMLFPMSFREIDEAHRLAQSGQPCSGSVSGKSNRARKRKPSEALLDDKGTYISERRTGRWTTEEMTYCDKLMAKFETGELPVSDSTRLNEFLGNMLKSKQSRLTKKMKNAKLSSKAFKRISGCLTGNEAREFSELEDSFFQAVTDMQERAEIKFHMQKEWREQFSRVCAAINQPLDADAWLISVEEMDRRASQARDAARMTKRKLMMGVALRQDSQNPDTGVFIERTDSENRAVAYTGTDDQDPEEEMWNMLAEDLTAAPLDLNGKSSLLHSAPFLAKVTAYVQRHNVPFEHIDVWVPSFVADGEEQDSTCRLCYAGSATVDKLVTDDGSKKTRILTPEEQFNLFAFGDYSQKFSFEVGCGLPGRVYESGRPTWEQSVQNAPHTHFERCGGAMQWGIKTVVGIPIASPNVGRIVVTLYSCFDRAKDEDVVDRLSEEFTRLMPSPKWKLVVDIGDTDETTPVPMSYNASAIATSETGVNAFEATDQFDALKSSIDVNSGSTLGGHQLAQELPAVQSAVVPVQVTNHTKDSRIDEVVELLGEFMPTDSSSQFLPGFMSLRLLLLRPPRNDVERDLVKTMMESYTSFASGGRGRADIAVMLARDYMFVSQQNSHQPPFLNIGQSMVPQSGSMYASSSSQHNNSLSLFGLPSTNSSPGNSPALTPILGPRIHDAMSVVSN